MASRWSYSSSIGPLLMASVQHSASTSVGLPGSIPVSPGKPPQVRDTVAVGIRVWLIRVLWKGAESVQFCWIGELSQI